MTYTLDDGAVQPELPFDEDEVTRITKLGLRDDEPIDGDLGKKLRELINVALNRRD